MDPWSQIGQGLMGGFSQGAQNPESQFYQLMQRRKFGGANPAAVGTVQQNMMDPAPMAMQHANPNAAFMGGNQGFGQPGPMQAGQMPMQNPMARRWPWQI